MKKLLLPLAIIFLLISCSETAEEATSGSVENTNDTIAAVDTITVVTEELANAEIPAIVNSLNHNGYAYEMQLAYTGKGIFYSSADQVALTDSETGEEINLETASLNGQEVNVLNSYLFSDNEDEYSCCDPWTEEEFCTNIVEVEIEKYKGYVVGTHVFLFSEYGADYDLVDMNGASFSIFRARNLSSCGSEAVLISKNNSDPQLIQLEEPDYFESAVLQLHGEWSVLEEPFLKDGYPVIRVTEGVDGNYTFSFYQLTMKSGAYIAENYFETDIMVNYDEFADGYDFEAELHERYKDELGEDFPSN